MLTPPSGGWTKSAVDGLTVGVARTSASSPPEDLLVTAFRIQVFTSCAAVGIAQSPASATVCAGQSATMSAVGVGIDTLLYEWYYNDGSGDRPITAPTPNLTSISVSAPGQYFCRVSSGCGAAALTARGTLSVWNPPSISQQPISATICQGQTNRFSITASGQRPLSYQWFYNNALISGANGPIHDDTRAGAYFCRVCLDCGTCTDSGAATLNVCEPGRIVNDLPSQASLCPNVPAIVLNASVAGCSPLTVRWFRDGVPLTAPGPDLVVTTGGDYRYEVSNRCNSQPVSSGTCRVTPIGGLSGVMVGGANPCPDRPASIRLQVTGGLPPYRYTWTNAVPVGDGSSALIYWSGTPRDCFSVAVEVRDACNQGFFTSAFPFSDPVVPRIVSQPTGGEYCVGSTASATVAASFQGACSLGNRYQWYKQTGGAAQPVVGATGRTLTLSPFLAADAGQYFARVSSECDSQFVESERITIGVKPSVVFQLAAPTQDCRGASVTLRPTSVVGAAPILWGWTRNSVPIFGNPDGSLNTTVDGATYCLTGANDCGSTPPQCVTLTPCDPVGAVTPDLPATVNFCAGGSRTLNAGFDGCDPRTFRWFRDGQFLQQTAVPSLTVSQAGRYRVEGSNRCNANPVSSRECEVIVESAPTFTRQPIGGDACEGTTFVLSVEATGTAPLRYQWKRDGQDISGATQPVLVINPVLAGSAGSYNCVVSNSCGSRNSDSAQLIVNPRPIITRQPQDQTICGTGSPPPIEFCVEASGTGLTYAWFKRCGVQVTRLASNTACTGPFVPTTADFDCTFYCEVQGPGSPGGRCPPARSTEARVIRQSRPVITAGPVPAFQSARACFAFNLEVTASGSGPLTYQWLKAGVPIDCTQNASACTQRLEITDARRPEDSGQYSCVVSSPGCEPTQSGIALVQVFCPADFDDGSGTGRQDNAVTIDDLIFYLELYGRGVPACDLTGDGRSCIGDGACTLEDLLFFIFHYEQGC